MIGWKGEERGEGKSKGMREKKGGGRDKEEGRRERKGGREKGRRGGKTNRKGRRGDSNQMSQNTLKAKNTV